MDLASRLRSVIRPGGSAQTGNPAPPGRELTYEPDDGRRYEAQLDVDRVADALGGRLLTTTFGRCLAIDRRYESDRWHGDVQIGDCELNDYESLRILDSAMAPDRGNPAPRAVFIDLSYPAALTRLGRAAGHHSTETLSAELDKVRPGVTVYGAFEAPDPDTWLVLDADSSDASMDQFMA